MGIAWMLSLLLGIGMMVAQAPATQAPAPAAATSPAAKEDPAVTALALKIYAQMRGGKVDASLLTDAMSKELSPEALALQKPIFDQLGDPVKLALENSEKTGDGTRWVYLATFAMAQLHVTIYVMKDGRVGGYALAL
jgi:hypothetical protein